MRKLRLLLFVVAGAIVFFSTRLLWEASDDSKNIVLSPETEERISKLQNEVEKLEKDLGISKKQVEDVYAAAEAKNKGKENDDGDEKNLKKESPIKMGNVKFESDDCNFAKSPSGLNSDVQMIDVYNLLSFENVDGGVWKQGFEINYNMDQWKEKPLKIFVVPHSHNDPGWLKTFELYYQAQTRQILNNILNFLNEDSQRKFIWAEISYLDLWWKEQGEAKRNQMKKLIMSHQLEIVTGGWVMNDEANTFYYAMIDQLIEGHEWLQKNIDPSFVTRDGWAIDPFGHSPTMAYILKRMDFDFMLIQRVHYSVKKYLAQKQNFEFQWRQNWDHSSSTDMFCHMMPFYSYDIPHTCGPDPKICCQFDFRRLPGGGMSCPWRIAPVPITDGNVAERASMLVDQYRKKAQLYKTNSLLIPLGDDFRYDVALGAQRQFSNYEALFRHINNNPEMRAKIQWGTLSDYFKSVQEDMAAGSFPKLSGDFYTYADRESHYWSGYYTSRPFYKNFDRTLESTLRSAEILLSFATRESHHQSKASSFPSASLFDLITGARRNLGLFQHHDAVTGTAKAAVVIDYGNKLLSALNGAHNVIKQSAQFLLAKDKSSFLDSLHFEMGDVREFQDSLQESRTIQISESPQAVYFYNSLEQKRNQVVCLQISDFHAIVKCEKMNPIQSQVNLVWTTPNSVSKDKYEICFPVEVAAFGFQVYYLTKDSGDLWKQYTHPSTVSIYKGTTDIQKPAEFDITSQQGSINIKNDFLSASFSKNQGLIELVRREKDSVHIGMQFLTYGTTNAKDRSGAYLFLPDGPARAVQEDATSIRLSSGILVESVVAQLPYVTQTTRLIQSSGLDGFSLHLHNRVDIRETHNFELVMRMNSAIQNSNRVFYTDLNGFQIQRRQTLDKLPLQANFYPMPSMAFIQDNSARLTLLSKQPLGFSSLETGYMEVVLDRRLMQDDSRGLGEGVKDNKITASNFLLLLEHSTLPPNPGQQTLPTQYPSLLAHLSQMRLMHSITNLLLRQPSESSLFMPSLSLANSLPCDVHMLNLRLMNNQKTTTSGLLLHRKGYDCRYPLIQRDECSFSRGKILLGKIFHNSIQSIVATSLSLAKEKEEVIGEDRAVHIDPMEINAYKVTW
ncbi:alpha-mannosidase 2-like isoform X2 [Oscarella lobularis]|uniref:alpha-mannosidase 2-like isoform X2 n=1 Tax=Oscarella lobularis TaxID=121494 RepID=UPI003313F4DC